VQTRNPRFEIRMTERQFLAFDNEQTAACRKDAETQRPKKTIDAKGRSQQSTKRAFAARLGKRRQCAFNRNAVAQKKQRNNESYRQLGSRSRKVMDPTN